MPNQVKRVILTNNQLEAHQKKMAEKARYKKDPPSQNKIDEIKKELIEGLKLKFTPNQWINPTEFESAAQVIPFKELLENFPYKEYSKLWKQSTLLPSIKNGLKGVLKECIRQHKYEDFVDTLGKFDEGYLQDRLPVFQDLLQLINNSTYLTFNSFEHTLESAISLSDLTEFYIDMCNKNDASASSSQTLGRNLLWRYPPSTIRNSLIELKEKALDSLSEEDIDHYIETENFVLQYEPQALNTSLYFAKGLGKLALAFGVLGFLLTALIYIPPAGVAIYLALTLVLSLPVGAMIATVASGWRDDFKAFYLLSKPLPQPVALVPAIDPQATSKFGVPATFSEENNLLKAPNRKRSKSLSWHPQEEFSLKSLATEKALTQQEPTPSSQKTSDQRRYSC